MHCANNLTKRSLTETLTPADLTLQPVFLLIYTRLQSRKQKGSPKKSTIMKRLIFTLSVIMIAGLATTAYSQVSIRASINLGRTGIYVKSAPVVYEPVYAPAPPPCYDNGYNQG